MSAHLGDSSISVTGDVYGRNSDTTTRATVDGLTDRVGYTGVPSRASPRKRW